jgi:hypothetical protein
MDRTHRGQQHSHSSQSLQGQASRACPPPQFYAPSHGREFRTPIQRRPTQDGSFTSLSSTMFTQHPTIPVQPVGPIYEAKQTMNTCGPPTYHQQQVHANSRAPMPNLAPYPYPVTHAAWQPPIAAPHGYVRPQLPQALPPMESYRKFLLFT